MKLALCLIAVLLLAGCGGGDSTGAVTGAGDSTAAAEATKEQTEETEPEATAEATTGESPSSDGGSSPPLVDPEPLPNEGEKTVAPDVPTSKGGDNSIQTYGVESSSDERVEAAQLVAEYLDAGVSGEWATACGAISSGLNRQFTALAQQMHKPAAGACESILPRLVSRASSADLRRAADIHVLSFRVDGDRGFLIYAERGGKRANFSLVREDGEWRIDSLAGYPLGT